MRKRLIVKIGSMDGAELQAFGSYDRDAGTVVIGIGIPALCAAGHAVYEVHRGSVLYCRGQKFYAVTVRNPGARDEVLEVALSEHDPLAPVELVEEVSIGDLFSEAATGGTTTEGGTDGDEAEREG